MHDSNITQFSNGFEKYLRTYRKFTLQTCYLIRLSKLLLKFTINRPDQNSFSNFEVV